MFALCASPCVRLRNPVILAHIRPIETDHHERTLCLGSLLTCRHTHTHHTHAGSDPAASYSRSPVCPPSSARACCTCTRLNSHSLNARQPCTPPTTASEMLLPPSTLVPRNSLECSQVNKSCIIVSNSSPAWLPRAALYLAQTLK